ncbi:hypothetical protein P4O66_002680 [Electrophorus voltai]|uniref:Uncharacterized protein n=1 Tax=Electrophorus voltai TaxID=2609070 RepID=A0AAD8YX03_9TELE|nr:hypothetical protein P4O66_002680 [Electrophorus voltai]
MANRDPEGKQRMQREEKASREASQRQEQAESSGTPSSLTQHPASQCPVSGQQARRPPGQDKVPEGHSGLQSPLLHRVVAEPSGTKPSSRPSSFRFTVWTGRQIRGSREVVECV